ncbi:hypothetical protein BH24ACT4_BH24ACT4_22130 [soil metagenome]
MTAPSLPRWARRAVTVPVALGAPWVLSGAAPVALPAALARDLADRDGRLWRSRAYAMAWAYAHAEAGGILASRALWAASAPSGGTASARSQRWHHTLQRSWAGSILAAARSLIDLRFEAHGTEDLGDGPLIVLGRHASLPDAFLPPRPAGTLALLDAAPDADVAILGHIGLEQLSSMSRLARSLPLRLPVRAELWRIPRAQVPLADDDRVEWLWQQWETLDAWVEALAARPEDPVATATSVAS